MKKILDLDSAKKVVRYGLNYGQKNKRNYLIKKYLIWFKKIFLKKLCLYKKCFVFKKYFIVKCTMAGISNQNILNFIEEKTNEDIKKILLVFFLEIL